MPDTICPEGKDHEAPEMKISVLVSGYDAAELYIVHEYGTGNLVALTNNERVVFAAELEHRYNTYATLVEALTKANESITHPARFCLEDVLDALEVQVDNALALAARKEGGR